MFVVWNDPDQLGITLMRTQKRLERWRAEEVYVFWHDVGKDSGNQPPS
jgi:hypothetical protein